MNPYLSNSKRMTKARRVQLILSIQGLLAQGSHAQADQVLKSIAMSLQEFAHMVDSYEKYGQDKLIMRNIIKKSV